MLVSHWLSGSADVTWCGGPWRGQRGPGRGGDAGQLGYQPFPVHPQPADGETPHQERGAASHLAGNSARMKLAHGYDLHISKMVKIATKKELSRIFSRV